MLSVGRWEDNVESEVEPKVDREKVEQNRLPI